MNRDREPATVGEALDVEGADPVARWHVRVLAGFYSADPMEKDRAEYALAENVRRNLHRFTRVRPPSRPSFVPDDDEILDLAEARTLRAVEKRRRAAFFVTWRDAVWAAESENAGRMAVVLDAGRAFARIGLDDEAREVATFLADEYGFHDPLPTTRGESRRFAARRTMDLDLLPDALRSLSRPEEPVDEADPEDDDSLLDDDLPEVPR